MNFVSYHECGVETKSEMTDNLVIVCFVFVFLDEISSTGKCDLVDIFFDFVSSHTKTVINEFQSFLFRVDDYADLSFVIIWQGIFAHHIKFL